MSALVSVVVPTRNSAETLESCLRSVREQSHPSVELIVVDNHSSDATIPIASAVADTVVTAGPERSAQRNVGARQSRGDYLLFIDSDMELDVGLVAECVSLASRGLAAVVIPEVSFGEGFWAACKRLERSCYLGDETIEAARFFQREAFFACGGYDEAITAGPEDWDIHARIRAATGSVARTASMIRHDEGELGFRELLATKYYYGKSTEAYIRKHSSLAGRQLHIFRPAFFRHWRGLVREPVLAVGMLFMKVCELSAGAAGLLVARLEARRAGLGV